MQFPSPERERKQAIRSVALTALLLLIVVVGLFQRPHWGTSVLALGFMAGYIFERIRLHRTLAALLDNAAANASSAGSET